MTQLLPLPRSKSIAIPLLLIFLVFPLLLKGFTYQAGEAEEYPCESLMQYMEVIPVAVSCSDKADGKLEIRLNNLNLSSISLSAGCEGIKSDIRGTTRNQSAVYSNLAAGWYQVIIKTREGCELTQCVEIESPAPLSWTITEHPLGCGEFTPSFTVEAVGGTPPFRLVNADNIAIDFDDTYTFENPEPGSHAYQLFDAGNCGPYEIHFEVPEEVLPLQGWVHQVFAPSCHEPEIGGFEIFVEGGKAPYHFSVEGEFADNLFFASSLPPGIYDVSVTDQHNCSLTLEIEVPQANQPVITVTEIMDADEGEENGQIWINLQGGTSPYQISLQAGCQEEDPLKSMEQTKSGSHIFWGVRAGVYTIRVIDQQGCVASKCVEVKEKAGSKTAELPSPITDLKDREPVSIRVFPNPFSEHTSFEFSSEKPVEASLEIYNLVGERVMVIFNGTLLAGEKQRHRFHRGDLPNGVYFYRLQTGHKTYYDKLIISR